MDNEIQNYLIDSLKHNKSIINANHPYPCGICQKNVNNNQKAIECSSCKYWVHIKCNGTTDDEYMTMISTNLNLSDEEIENDEWLCNKCQIENLANVFPFGLQNNYELKNIMNIDSLNSLKNLPSYDIASKACEIDSLNKYDIDEHIINNINSRYYPVTEFQMINKPQTFNILHSNLNGLEGKFEQYHNFISSSNMDIDVLCISETSQKENSNFDNNINIEGYKEPFSLGSKTSKGGVTIFTKKDLNVVERNDLNLVDISFEAVWIEIKNDKTKNIVCGCFYRHPKSNVDVFKNYLSKCLTKINKENKECFLSGDFNIDLLKCDTNLNYSEFLNILVSFVFLPHILQPTRITEYSSTLIDNIYGNNFKQDTCSGNILIKFADHFSQFLSINKEVSKVKPIEVYKRDYKDFDEKSFIDDISIQKWTAIVTNDVNSKFDDFLWRVEGCVDRHAPLKKMNKKQIKLKSKPWINGYILKMINHRERLFRKKKEDPINMVFRNAYNLFRNRITREIKKSKKEYYKKYFENNLDNIKKTWQGIKQIINLNNNTAPQITQLNYKSKHVNTNLGMANAFNEFFTDIGPLLDKEIPLCKKPGGINLHLNKNTTQSFLISPTNPQEIIEIINALDENKSSGPCSIPTTLLKLAKDELSIPLSEICNRSFEEGIFPEQNKIAKVIPSHKKGPTDDVNNYRPISLLSVFSKIMEKLMATRLNNYLELHDIIYPNQFGFRAGYSTSHSLISITETIKKTLDNKKYGCGVFIDLKKAFDTVNHDILLMKLQNYGIYT